MFAHPTTVRLHDTDAAGVIYFASLLRMAHEAFEAALENAGLHLGDVLATGEILTPVVHAEADYLAPLRLSDRVRIEVHADRVGDTSFSISYRFVKQSDQVAAHAKTVHVAIDRTNGSKKTLPDALRSLLGRL